MKRLLLSLALSAGIGCILSASWTCSQSLAQDQTLVWGEDTKDEITLDPRMAQSLHADQAMIQMFAMLLYLDENDKLWPWLAKDFSQSADGKSVSLTLRDDVTFADGTPFNADAVKFTFDSIMDPSLASRSLDMLGPYASTEVIDPTHLIIHYNQPYANALVSLSQINLAPVSPTAVKKLGDEDFGTAPVGAGPYAFVSWERGQQIVMKARKDYDWAPEPMDHQGPAAIANIIQRNIPDASTRVAALETGEVTVADAVPPLDMRRLKDSGYGTASSVSNGVPFGVFMNMSHPPFSDPIVRQALTMSLDREKMTDNLFFGFVPAQFGALSSTMPTYWPGAKDLYPYDPKKAGELLDSDGWTMGADGIREKDGQKLTASFPVLIEPDTALAVQAAAKKVGFDLQVETVLKQMQDDKILRNDYDMMAVRWISVDPNALSTFYASENIPKEGDYGFNWSRMNDPEVDALLKKARSASDPDERIKNYQAVQEAVMKQAPFIPLHSNVEAIAYQSSVTGLKFFRANGNFLVNFYDTQISE